MLRKTRSIFGALGVVLALGVLTPGAWANDILVGDIFFTTLGPVANASCPILAGCNVWKVHFVYDSTPQVTLSGITGLALLDGADGIVFNPNNLNLLVGEQNQNKVAQLPTTGSPVTVVTADPVSLNFATPPVNAGQAYAVVVTPDKSTLITFPNDALGNADWTGNKVITVPLTPFANGTAVTITGSEDSFPDNVIGLRTGAYDAGGTLYYGDDPDFFTIGHFGTMATTAGGVPTGGTTRITPIPDATNGGANVDGALPTHALEFDPLTGCMIASGSTEIWDLCKVAGTWTVTSKVSNPAGLAGPNWDQTINDGKGHMFGADNEGNLIFMDYSATTGNQIGGVNGGVFTGASGGAVGSFYSVKFLADKLDDIAFVQSVNLNGCPATKGFWHLISKHPWPTTTITIGTGPNAVIYNGSVAGAATITIGGTLYHEADLVPFLTASAKGGNGLVIGGSQLVAAVLNMANGSPQPANVVDAITTMSGDLVSINMLGAESQITSAMNAALVSLGGTLDTYNGSAGTLGCVEGTPAH